MVVDLEAGTDTAACVLFDPGALDHLAPADITETRTVHEAFLGNLLLLNTAADGSYSFRVYLDERPPPEVIGDARDEEPGRLLRVPTGVLRASGAEYLGRRASDVPPNQMRSVKIPPGNYLVDAYVTGIDAEDSPTVVVAMTRLPDGANSPALKGATLRCD